MRTSDNVYMKKYMNKLRMYREINMRSTFTLVESYDYQLSSDK